MLPAPPSSTAASTRIEFSSRNVEALTKLAWPAHSAPDRPPMPAPIANAQSLNLNVGTPMSSAASSSSRIATQARPTRLRTRFRIRKTIRMITVRTSQ